MRTAGVREARRKCSAVPDLAAFRRAVPVFDPPLSITIAEEREDRR